MLCVEAGQFLVKVGVAADVGVLVHKVLIQKLRAVHHIGLGLHFGAGAGEGSAAHIGSAAPLAGLFQHHHIGSGLGGGQGGVHAGKAAADHNDVGLVKGQLHIGGLALLHRLGLPPGHGQSVGHGLLDGVRGDGGPGNAVHLGGVGLLDGGGDLLDGGVGNAGGLCMVGHLHGGDGVLIHRDLHGQLAAHAVFRDTHIGAGGIDPLLVLFGAGAQIQAKGQRQCERQCFLFHLTSSLFGKVLSLCLKDKENRDIPVAHIITNFPFCFKPFRSLTAKRAAR